MENTYHKNKEDRNLYKRFNNEGARYFDPTAILMGKFKGNWILLFAPHLFTAIKANVESLPGFLESI